MNYIDKILSIGKANGGYVRGKDLSERGIPRVYLSRLNKRDVLRCLAQGIYILSDYVEDEIYTFALRYSKASFSRYTAMYLNGLTNRQLECIQANFPVTYNTTKIQGIKCYQPCKQLYELGQATVTTPLGHMVKSYNIERCICDLFYFDEFDIEDKSYAVKVIDKSRLDYDKLFSYAETMKVLPQVKSVFEVI